MGGEKELSLDGWRAGDACRAGRGRLCVSIPNICECSRVSGVCTKLVCAFDVRMYSNVQACEHECVSVSEHIFVSASTSVQMSWVYRREDGCVPVGVCVSALE